VDLQKSSLCGYLTILHLTDDFPKLTTFFEADVIGPQHSFFTEKFDASENDDHYYWSQFPEFKQLNEAKNYVSETEVSLSPRSKEFYNFNQHDSVFMRWKELFLVPDHRIEHISGASYAGFYYIAYDYRKNTIDGYYYHKENPTTRSLQRIQMTYQPKFTHPWFEFK